MVIDGPECTCCSCSVKVPGEVCGSLANTPQKKCFDRSHQIYHFIKTNRGAWSSLCERSRFGIARRAALTRFACTSASNSSAEKLCCMWSAIVDVCKKYCTKGRAFSLLPFIDLRPFSCWPSFLPPPPDDAPSCKIKSGGCPCPFRSTSSSTGELMMR